VWRWENGVYGEEWHRNHSEAIKAAHERGVYGDEWYHKMTEAVRETWKDKELRRKQSEDTKQRWEDGIYDEERDQKISECVKAAWERGVYGEEWRQKQSGAQKRAWERGAHDEESLREHSEAIGAAWERGAYDNRREHPEVTPETRCKMSEARKIAWANGVYDGVFQSPTSIEQELMAALDIMGIEHWPQYRPDGCRFTFDEYVPESNLLIEADGDYWHSTARSKKQDIKKNTWAKENGYTLLRISESDIKEFGAWSIVIERVLSLVKAA